ADRDSVVREREKVSGTPHAS
ncbi:hypothetical protein KIPB_009399, partial [Kipferlia bialata]